MGKLMALFLMIALLAIGTPAAAGPFGVSMGDLFEPDKGWNIKGYGEEKRKYEGDLPFDTITLVGTRKHGVCTVFAVNIEQAKGPALRSYKNVRNLLINKYGEPGEEEPKTPTAFGKDPEARWHLDSNPDKIISIVLLISGSFAYPYESLILKYFFENYDECPKAQAGEL